ncbi:PQQ-binding-like beta-propeller repeat protein [Streptomyces sp. NPDC048156]|uniref:PQQ-binding-like beta-propeller repeat protein n=1 Tax=Streptomyces sp. NPDC048156 TaxID=3365502 RepID=UPI00371AF3F8
MALRARKAPLTSPAVWGTVAYVAGRDGTVRAYDTTAADPSKPLWETKVGYLPGRSPMDDKWRVAQGCSAGSNEVLRPGGWPPGGG